jgi:hypothetical protein
MYSIKVRPSINKIITHSTTPWGCRKTPSSSRNSKIKRTRIIPKAYHHLPVQFEILPSDGGVNDVVNLTIFNTTAWILPMAITGRIMGIEWKDLSLNLLGLSIFRSALETFHDLNN